MREILFRAKAINRDRGEFRTNYKNGDWVYGLVTKFNVEFDIGSLPMQMTNTNGISGIDVDHNTLGRFTTLTDKNGKKIFEGDIVKTKYGRLCVVEWRSTPCFCGFDLMVCANWDDFGKAPSSWDLYMPQNLEIVGNIHDNKELLGE